MTKEEIRILKSFKIIERKTWPRTNWVYSEGPYVWARCNHNKTWSICFFQDREFNTLQEAIDALEAIAAKAPEQAFRDRYNGFAIKVDGHVASLSFNDKSKWYARYRENSMLHSEWVDTPQDALDGLPKFTTENTYKPVGFFEYKDNEGMVME